MSAQRRLLAQPIVHLVITTLLILLSALTMSNEETEWISFTIWIVLFFDPNIVHHILSPNKKETKQEGKPERIFPELDIPPPILEENKATYLAPLIPNELLKITGNGKPYFCDGDPIKFEKNIVSKTAIKPPKKTTKKFKS